MDYAKELYHYTDLEALHGIICNKELWLGNISNMNDKSEAIGYLNNITVQIQKRFSDKRILRYIRFYSKLSDMQKELNPFALCFSANEDDAGMWERYANNARGVCIGFNREFLEKIFEGSEFYLINENYNLDIESDLLDSIENLLSLDGTNDDAEIELMGQILLKACSHKHGGFKSEKEIRLVTLYPDFLDEKYEEIEISVNKDRIKRILKIKLKEYCKIHNFSEEDLKNNLIKSIIVGPRSQQNISDLKWYLRKNGYINLAENVYFSNCPLR